VPSTLTGVLIFAILVVPGYQLVRGYAVARGDAPPTVQLHVLAQAVVASLGWLVFTWPFVTDLLRWVSSDTIADHVAASYAIAPLLLGTPYCVGRWLGRLVGAITRSKDPFGPPWLLRVVRALGLVERATPWDLLWHQATDEVRAAGAPDGKTALVTVSLDDGTSLSGQFGANSLWMPAPAEPSIYFQRAYEADPLTGEITVYAGGAHVDGRRIVALKLEPLP